MKDEWTAYDESMPVVGHEIEIRFNDCCVNGVISGVVIQIQKAEDSYPVITFDHGSEFEGYFDWRLV